MRAPRTLAIAMLLACGWDCGSAMEHGRSAEASSAFAPIGFGACESDLHELNGGISGELASLTGFAGISNNFSNSLAFYDPDTLASEPSEPLSATVSRHILGKLDDESISAFVGMTNGMVQRVTRTEANDDWEFVWEKILSAGVGCTINTGKPAFFPFSEGSIDFQNTYESDVVIAGTRSSSCSTTNRIYALDARDSSEHWVFNEGATFSMDQVSGLIADSENDILYVATDRRAATDQSSLWAFSILDGTLIWDASVGQFFNEPILRNGRIYAINVFGELVAVDALSGTVMWTEDLSPDDSLIFISNPVAPPAGPFSDLILVVGTDTVFAVRDMGNSGVIAWDEQLPAIPPVDNKDLLTLDHSGSRLFVSGETGQIREFEVLDGSLRDSAQVDTSTEEVTHAIFVRPVDTPPFPSAPDRVYASSDTWISKLCLGTPQVSTNIPNGRLAESDIDPGETGVIPIFFEEAGTANGLALGMANALVSCELLTGEHYSLLQESAVVYFGETATLEIEVTAPIDGSLPTDVLTCEMDDGSIYQINLGILPPDVIDHDSMEGDLIF